MFISYQRSCSYPEQFRYNRGLCKQSPVYLKDISTKEFLMSSASHKFPHILLYQGEEVPQVMRL